MPSSQGKLKPFVSMNTSTEIHNSVGYPVGGNVTSTTSAVFTATFSATSNTMNVTYVTSGTVVPGMVLSAIGIAPGTTVLGPLNQNGTGTGGLGSYTLSLLTLTSKTGVTVTGQATQASNGPGGIVGPVPGFNCVNIQDLRDYYNLPYPPPTPLASPPVIAVVSFGGGIYGQPVTTGQYAGFWKCTDISGSNGAPIQILVAPINGAINAPNADDGGATLENTVDVATINAFYGMIDPRRDAPVYTPPVIILYIAPSSDISEMYRTFYTVLKNPVVCNGKSYQPTVVSCSWGAPEVAWTQKMAFPPNPSMPVDNSPNPEGIAEMNEINNLFAEATQNGINICCASGDIPLTTVNSSVNTFNYAQALLLQGMNGPGYPNDASGNPQVPQPQPSVFPLTSAQRASLPAPKVMFPASSPYVTCVGGSAVYFPNIAVGSYSNPAEFAWARANGGISTAFSIPAYQQNQPGAASTSAAQFLASSLNTANLAQTALGTPAPVYNTISGGYSAPNTAVTLATQTKNDAYTATLTAFNAAQNALVAAQLSASDDALMNSLVQTVKDASTSLATAQSNRKLADDAKEAAEDLVVKTQTVSSLLVKAGTVFGAAAGVTEATSATGNSVLVAQMAAQQAAYNQLVSPSTTNSMLLQNANQALQAAQLAANSSALASTTLPVAVTDTTDVANKAVAQAASAVIAPSLAAHPYLMGIPITSPLPIKSNDAYNTAQTVAAALPYDANANTAPSYLLNTIGLTYTVNQADASGVDVSGNNNLRQRLQDSVAASDALTYELANVPPAHLTGDSGATKGQAALIGEVASLTDKQIFAVQGQDVSGSNVPAITAVIARTNTGSSVGYLELLPSAGLGSVYSGTNTKANLFAAHAATLSSQGAALISSYQSGAADSDCDGYGLPCGLASANASILATIYTVTNPEKEADKEAGFPYGSTDTSGGVDASGTYNGITPGLINLRNIYANTTLSARRMTTAHKAAHKAKEAFLVWYDANERVTSLQSEATALYNTVPTPSNDEVRKMDTKLVAAKVALSEATYNLGVSKNYAVSTSRLAHQSATSASLVMGNWIDAAGTGASFDQLGNLNSVANTNSGAGQPTTVAAQGANNVNCPAISLIDASGSTVAKNALVAAQALSLAAANDNYLTTSVTTWNTHGLSGVDSSGNETVSLTGTRLVVQDAQFAAAAAAGQVANVAFADASESLARFSDWHNVAVVANAANAAQALVYAALQDASGGTMPSDASGNTALVQAVNAITSTVSLIISATTPFNQQATTSATIATNDTVALAAKLENLLNVCTVAQTAIQLAASTYNGSSSSNISGQAGQGGSIFTVNMAYAKVTADAAAAAATAAAILAREEAVLVAKRANYSAMALRKLVGEGVVGGAVAGFVDASGNLVSQTGYDVSYPLPYTAGGANTVNGNYPPSVTTPTILYQGNGGIDFNSVPGSIGFLEELSNAQPSVITNLAYTSSQYDNVYSAVAGLADDAQAVLNVLQSDSSGNTADQLALPNNYLSYPNVNAANALDAALGNTGGSGTNAVHACLLSAYEAQQWVVASANASFVTFGYSPANVNLVSFTPTLMGVVTKLASDADACLQTVLNAEGAILYAVSKRPNPVSLHDLDASNFACIINANQAVADTYLELTEKAIAHEKNTLVAFHKADLANALSPLTANAQTSAGQAAALGAMAWSSPTTNPNYASNSALVNANFPANGWGSASMPSVTSNLSAQNANSTNPNLGPYNGTATGLAPFPAPNASNSSRIQAPAAQVLQVSAQFLQGVLSDATLAAAHAASDAAYSSVEFNAEMVEVSTVTPSLVDAATSASNLTLAAAQSAELATGLDNQGTVATNLTNFVAQLLLKEKTAILAAAQSARANLEAISVGDARYSSRKNMLDLWNKAITAVRDAVDAADEAPTNFPYITTTTPNGTTQLLDPSQIVPASLGNLVIMGTTNGVYTTNGNTAPVWVPYNTTVTGVTPSPADSTQVQYGPDNTTISVNRPSLLSLLNAAVINAYNATTGAPDSSGNYRYITFLDASGNRQTNMPENVNDTQQAYNNAKAAFNANSALSSSTLSSVLNAAIAIKAAYDAAVAVNQQSPVYTGPPTVDASGNAYSPSSPQGLFYTWAANVSNFGPNALTSVAVGFWNVALEYVNSLINGTRTLNATNLANLMAIVGINFNTIQPVDNSAQAIAFANSMNKIQNDIMNSWQAGPGQTSPYALAYGSGTAASPAPVANGGSNANCWPGYVDASGNLIPTYANNSNLTNGQAWATYVNGSTATSWPSTAAFGQDSNASAYYFTVAIMGSGNVAFQTAYNAWQAVLTAVNTISNGSSTLDVNAANAIVTKAVAAYSVKLALQSAARASASAQVSALATAGLATSTGSYEDLAAEAASEAAYASSGNLNMYRCVPDIAMHANADDLPVIFRLNGGNVYVGGTSVAASMFAGFLGVVQSHAPINYFINPMLYDNYTSPSPLFNSINGSAQVWNGVSPNGSIVPARLANVLPGNQNPLSGLGSGLYNCNIGLGSIKGMNLGALMEVPHLVTGVYPNNTNNIVTTVYPGTSQVVTAYVEPVTAYNPNLVWSCSSPNAVVSKTNGPALSNNGQNDTDPYTTYNPLQKDASGNQLAFPSSSIGDYALGSVGNVALGTNPYTGNPCLIFTATVTGVTAVPASAALPVVTVSSTDGSSVYGQYSVLVLPAIQVTGVSISYLNEMENPANTTLFLGTTLQLVANVTPVKATNKRVYWWSSNTSVVNVDASGLLTSLAPGQVTIKATSMNNNISASISVYVPTPITGLSVLPTSITLNPNMGAVPLRNLGLINAIVQPAEADYKHLTWEVVSSQQSQPAPAGMSDVISLPRDGTVLARDGSGDITDNTRATVTALSNGTAVIKVSTYGEPYGVYGTYTAMVTVNVVTPVTDVVMEESDMVINLNPETAKQPVLPDSYHITATLKPAYPSNMNVFWSSSNPKVAVVSNNSTAVLNTTFSDPNFGLWQITETVTPLSNGTTVIKVTTADGSKTAMTTVVVTTPVTGLSMSALPVMLNPTKLYTLQATVLPTTATNRALLWESTNTAIATVDNNGVVKAVSTGSCGISATTLDGDYTAISQVNVVTPLVGVQLMVNTPLPIHINDVVQILVVMVPTTASNQQFTWTVTDGIDGNIFTTGPPQNGNIVYLDAVQAGNSVFTVTTADGNKQASINLQVVQW